MAIETERKFLLKDDSWNTGIKGTLYKQGYLMTSRERTVRVRIAGDHAYITIKGPMQDGILAKSEFEYEIPIVDAEELYDYVCLPEKIEKTRYEIPYEGHIWEVDIFHGLNEGLIMAEVELQNEHEELAIPPWIGEEVSHDRRYFNGLLAKEPFTTWQ